MPPVLIFLPLAGALSVALLPRDRDETARRVGVGASLATVLAAGGGVYAFGAPRRVGVGASLATVLAAVGVFYAFDASSGALQLLERREWLPSLGIAYSVG